MTQLTRDVENRCCNITGGVCSGLALYSKRQGHEVDASLIRILFALVALMTTGIPVLLIYLILWAVMPAEGQQGENNE